MSKYLNNIVIIIICLLTFRAESTLYAQSNPRKLDSLLAILPGAAQDTNKVSLLCGIANCYFQEDPTKGISYGGRALQLANMLHDDRGVMVASMAMGRCYSVQENSAMALKYFHDALVAAQKTGDKIGTAKALQSCGIAYQLNQEYTTALNYFLSAKNIYAGAGVPGTTQLMNNIGSLYMDEEKNGEALSYFMQGVALLQAGNPDPAQLATSYGTIGVAHINLKHYDSGLHYFFKAVPYVASTGSKQTAAHLLNNIGNAYYQVATVPNAVVPDSLKDRHRNLQKALVFELQALNIGNELKLRRLLEYVLPNISDIYEAMGEYKEALTYQKRYRLLQDSTHDADNEKAFARIDAEYKVKLTTDSLKMQNMRKDKELIQKRTERWVLIFAIIFITIVTLLLISRQQLKHQQRLRMAQAQRQRVEELALHQLNDFTQRIQEKNALIESITSQIAERQQAAEDTIAPVNYALLQELQQSILLTDDQWDKFKNTFDKVHTGYFHRLKSKMPDLSPAETRLIMLSKLHLTPKEMGAMLGVSAQAMRVNKHRLIKKLGTEDDNALEHLIHSI